MARSLKIVSLFCLLLSLAVPSLFAPMPVKAALAPLDSVCGSDGAQVACWQMEEGSGAQILDGTGYANNGDYLDYKITVPQAGDYTIRFRVASLYSNGSMSIRLGDAGGTFTLNANGTLNFAPGNLPNILQPGESVVTKLSYQVSESSAGGSHLVLRSPCFGKMPATPIAAREPAASCRGRLAPAPSRRGLRFSPSRGHPRNQRNPDRTRQKPHF